MTFYALYADAAGRDCDCPVTAVYAGPQTAVQAGKGLGVGIKGTDFLFIYRINKWKSTACIFVNQYENIRLTILSGCVILLPVNQKKNTG